jgi:hypothetical protein
MGVVKVNKKENGKEQEETETRDLTLGNMSARAVQEEAGGEFSDGASTANDK